MVTTEISKYNLKYPLVNLINARCDKITENDEENNLTEGYLSCAETDDSDPKNYIYIDLMHKKVKMTLLE